MTPHWVGNLGTALVMAAFLLQISILVRKRRAGALSLGSSLLNLTASASLMGYALLRADQTFVIVMGAQLVATCVILALHLRYRNRPA